MRVAVLFALLLLGDAVPVRSAGRNGEPPEFDVIVIGAGAAGLAASAALLRNNVTRIQILEARNYTGGRVHAVPFGTKGVMIEEGANWVHGVPSDAGSGKNPVWQMARAARLATVRVPGSCGNISGYNLFTEKGALVEHGRARSDAAMSIFDCANITGQKIGGKPDISLDTALRRCGWQDGDSVDSMMKWEVGSANDLLPSQNLSLKWMLPDDTYAVYGPDDHFVYDQRDRGYATVLDELVPAEMLASKLRLGSPVQGINDVRTICDGVLVRTSDNEFCGRHAIVTMPLGVMQQQHSHIFKVPPLPYEQASALSAIDMGNFTKLHIEFPVNFWSKRGVQWMAALREHDQPDDPVEFHDLDSLVSGSNVLFTYVTGAAATRWESYTDAQASAALVIRLRAQFGADVVPEPLSFHMTRHGSDEFMRGAYSAVPVGTSSYNMAAVFKPLKYPGRNNSTVTFAGEHTCPAYQGYLHGGYSSGLRAAAQVLRELGKKEAAVATYRGECGDN